MAEGSFTSRTKLKVLRSMIPDCKRYLVPSKIMSDLHPYVLDADQMRNILEKEGQSRREAVELLMEAVLEKEEDGLSYFINALNQGNNNYDRFLNPLEDNLAQEGMNHPEVSKYFEFIIQCLEGDITRFLMEEEFKDLLRKLLSEAAIDEEDMESLLNMSSSKRGINLFRMMPQYATDWPLKFFRALKEVKPDMVLKCDPLGECPYEEVNKEAAAFSNAQQEEPDLEQTSPKRLRRSDDEDEDIPMELEEELLGSDEESREFSDEEEKEDDDTEKGAQPQPLTLRRYQYELAAPALKGENTIICAPTGSGKTRVALYITKKHLTCDDEEVNKEAAAFSNAQQEEPDLEQTSPKRLHRSDDEGPKKRKVVFMARTVPLVLQQFKIFEKYLPRLKCYKLHGETVDHQDLHLMLDDLDILVMTPKILDNHLIHKKLESLSVFSLLIFDECHHTRKGEPYNSVMKQYLQFKDSGQRGLPQIVGLTASIGVEKASTVESAQNSIIEIMANLDVKSITKVRENVDELATIVPTPDEKLEKLTPRENDAVSRSIYHNMMQVEHLLKNQVPQRLDQAEFQGVNSVLSKRPPTRNSQKYGQWAVKVCDQARKIHIPEQPDDQLTAEVIERRRLVSQNVQLLAETLIAYNEALDVHELTRPVDVLDHLKKKLDPRHTADSPAPTEVEIELQSLFKELRKKLQSEAAARNPNLDKLSSVIKEGLQGKWENSRVMVFVRTRATCQALCSWLNTDKRVSSDLRQLHASPFTGTGAHQEVGGMTQHLQEGVIEKFREGDVKLLVCTTVGQEGIDIPDCNLVIRYNQVGNEVATVQTRGRCRKLGGMSVLLAMPDVIRKEHMNKSRVEIMNKAIEMVNETRCKEVTNKIRKAQQQARDKDEIKRIARMKVEDSKVKRDNFTLACARCRNVRVPGALIRTINASHHVVIGMGLKDKGEVSIKFKDKPKMFDNLQFTGEIICNKCPVMKQSLLGTILKFEETDFLALKAESWVVLDDKQHVENSGKWKWKDIRYAIPELTPQDMRAHVGLLQENEEGEGGAAAAAGGMSD